MRTCKILIGVVILLGLLAGNSIASGYSYNYKDRPVIVNIQVNLESNGDQAYIDKILTEVEKYKGWTTVFVTGEFASKYPEIIKKIEARGHQIAVHGWQEGEDISKLKAEEQFRLIQKAFSAVRSTVNKPEEITDFKPQGYKFNDDTIRILQQLGVRSISGIFSSDESFCKCWYAKQLGKITFPYPITDKFWAIPISLDDKDVTNYQTFLKYLIEKYEHKFKTKEPLIIAFRPSIIGADEAKLNAFSQFLDDVEQNNGKIKPLSALTHHTQYITNFDVIPSTTTASVGEEITVSGKYTANIYCPHYRFRVYGKYKDSEQDWKLLEKDKEIFPSPSYCEFVYLGEHPLSWKIKIPMFPEIIPPPEKYIYQIRVVGKASFGGCGESDLWPCPHDKGDCWESGAKKDIEIEIKPLCIPYEINGSEYEKKDLIFVPDGDYKEGITLFKQHIKDLIENQYGKTEPISNNINKFNFYYTEREGNAENFTLPAGFWEDLSCKFADAVAILHKFNFPDGTLGKVFTAEGSGTRAFIHESGHAIFDLADEYTETRQPPDCTDYTPASIYPNIWSTKAECESDARNEGWDVSRCANFCPLSNPCCGNGWWKIDRTPNECKDLNDCDEVMIDNDNGFGVACQRRINYEFNQLPVLIDILYPCTWCSVYAEKLVENSITLYLNINNDQLTLLGSEFSKSSPPNYYLGEYPFKAIIFSLSNELLGEYGFRDPRRVRAEIGYEGHTWIDNVDFPLILPYFHNVGTVNIYNSINELLLSVNVSQYASGIIEGRVNDYNGNAVVNAFIQATPSGGSTYTHNEGNYQLVGLKPGSYTISVRPDPYLNLMMAFASISVSAGEIVTQNFSLNPAGSIAGQVTDINGNPVPNVSLYLSGYETPNHATNEEGKYIIPYLGAGTQTISIHAPEYGNWYIFVNGSYVKYGKSVTVNVTLGQTTWVDFFQQSPPSPDILVHPESFQITLPSGKVTTDTLIIGNSGNALLEFEIEDYSLGMVIDDPAEGGIFDVKKVSLTSTPPNINFNIETYTSLEGVEGSGYFWLDTDQNPLTGIAGELWDSGLNDIGADYFLTFYFSHWGSWAKIYRLEGYQQIGSYYPLSLDGNHLIISIPLSSIGDDGIMDVTFMGEGNFGWEGSIDIVPNVGHGTTTKFDEIDWFSLSPEHGTVEPGSQINVTLTIDTTNLKPGEYQRFITITSNDIDERVVHIPVYLTVKGIPAFVDFDPDTLNLKSKGQWVTVYIELPVGYDINKIAFQSIRLNNQLPIEPKPIKIGDYNNNGIPDLMAKFSRSAVQNILRVGDKVKIIISGELIDGTSFEGSDMIRVILK